MPHPQIILRNMKVEPDKVSIPWPRSRKCLLQSKKDIPTEIGLRWVKEPRHPEHFIAKRCIPPPMHNVSTLRPMITIRSVDQSDTFCHGEKRFPNLRRGARHEELVDGIGLVIVPAACRFDEVLDCKGPHCGELQHERRWEKNEQLGRSSTIKNCLNVSAVRCFAESGRNEQVARSTCGELCKPNPSHPTLKVGAQQKFSRIFQAPNMRRRSNINIIIITHHPSSPETWI